MAVAHSTGGIEAGAVGLNGDARLDALLGSIAEALITVDQRGAIESVNPAAQRLFAYGADDLIGRAFAGLLADANRDEYEGYIRNFAGGKPGNGWTLTVGEQSAKRSVLPTSTGATASGALLVSAIDRAAQEDARLATWSGGAPATISIESAAPVDLQRESNGEVSLVFDYRVDAAPSSGVELAIECGERCRGTLPIERHLRETPAGEWRQLKVPLRCFEHDGADMRRVTAPFSIASAGALKLGLANIRLDTGLNGALSPAIQAAAINASEDPACTGTAAAPTAPPGKVCVYVVESSIANVMNDSLQPQPLDFSGSPLTVFGFNVFVKAGAGPVTTANGTWAYTAP